MIFPIFLMVCIFLVYLGLYQYDRCITQQSLYYALVREKELSYATKNEYEEIINNIFNETLDKQYLIAVNGTAICKSDYGKLVLEYVGDMFTPWLDIPSGIKKEQWELQVRGEKQRWQPVAFIRFCNRLKGE